MAREGATPISRPRRWLFALLTVVALLAVAEGLSLAALHLLEGRGPGELAAEARRLAGEEVAAPDTPAPIAVPRFLTHEVVHPFLGFVFNPELNDSEERRKHEQLAITERGFFRDPGPPPERTGRELRIGVFGGSVALLFAFEGREALAEELAALPVVAERGLVVDSFALGGYKQPQQLMALAYLLALGERFDAVVNLDGFNDVALSSENAAQGVDPSYPRSWPLRLADVADPELLRLAGELTYLRGRRLELARSFAAAPLAHSPTWGLAWRLRDRRLVARVAELEAELAGFRPAGGGYQSTGPAPDGAGEEALYRRLARLWAESSYQMHRLCTANGIRYYHLLQPNQYLPGSKPMGAEERAVAFRERHPYRRSIELGYPLLQAAGRELAGRGVSFHDLTGLFAGIREPLYVDACCHFSPRGSELIARTLARVIREDVG